MYKLGQLLKHRGVILVRVASGEDSGTNNREGPLVCLISQRFEEDYTMLLEDDTSWNSLHSCHWGLEHIYARTETTRDYGAPLRTSVGSSLKSLLETLDFSFLSVVSGYCLLNVL